MNRKKKVDESELLMRPAKAAQGEPTMTREEFNKKMQELHEKYMPMQVSDFPFTQAQLQQTQMDRIEQKLDMILFPFPMTVRSSGGEGAKRITS